MDRIIASQLHRVLSLALLNSNWFYLRGEEEGEKEKMGVIPTSTRFSTRFNVVRSAAQGDRYPGTTYGCIV